MICSKCGGQRTAAKCNLCDLFASGQAYDEVRKMRANNPQPSLALKVHESQVGEATAFARQHGVPTEFTPDGRPLFTSRRHKQEYCKITGYFNRDEV